MSLTQQQELARRVREECIQTAISAYENASISGLCGEGAFEAAVSAIRMLDVDRLAERTVETDNSGAGPAEGSGRGEEAGR